MKENQKGFSTIEALLIAVLMGLIGFVGWYVWQNKQRSSTPSNSNNSTQSNSGDNKNTPAKIDTTIHDVNIALQSAADINKLPPYTPESFKTYMLEKLQKNVPVDGCVNKYTLTKISQVNIKGSGVSTSVSGDSQAGYCVGGAPGLYILAPNGQWDEVTLNGASCKSSRGGLVYEEFAPECIPDPPTSSFIKNPNGSITTLAKQL